jgi:hypothetical protein
MLPLDPLAGLDVEPGEEEKDERDQNHQKVGHARALGLCMPPKVGDELSERCQDRGSGHQDGIKMWVRALPEAPIGRKGPIFSTCRAVSPRAPPGNK